MDEQNRNIYKRVESEGIINVNTVKQELKEDKSDRNIVEDKINPYHEIIAIKIEKENIIMIQMEQWSILSNIVNYVQYD